MTIHRLNFTAERTMFRNGIDLYGWADDAKRDGFHALQPATARFVEDTGLRGEPFLHIKMDAAQQLMDELWRCGIRPTEGQGSAGSLAATERHLADMRDIAMHKLGMK